MLKRIFALKTEKELEKIAGKELQISYVTKYY
jgi:hypothetical protein